MGRKGQKEGYCMSTNTNIQTDTNSSSHKKTWKMTRSTLARGALSGLSGGIVMVVFAFALGAIIKGDPWLILKLPAAPLLGIVALSVDSSAQTLLVGASVHVIVSLFWGALFGFTFYGLKKGVTVIAGLLFGLAVWIPMYYAVLPIVGHQTITSLSPPMWVMVEHLVFGGVTGLVFAWVQRDFGKRRWDKSFSRLWDAE